MLVSSEDQVLGAAEGGHVSEGEAGGLHSEVPRRLDHRTLEDHAGGLAVLGGPAALRVAREALGAGEPETGVAGIQSLALEQGILEKRKKENY